MKLESWYKGQKVYPLSMIFTYPGNLFTTVEYVESCEERLRVMAGEDEAYDLLSVLYQDFYTFHQINLIRLANLSWII